MLPKNLTLVFHRVFLNPRWRTPLYQYPKLLQRPLLPSFSLHISIILCAGTAQKNNYVSHNYKLCKHIITNFTTLHNASKILWRDLLMHCKIPQRLWTWFFVVMEIETKGLKCIVTNGNSGRKKLFGWRINIFSNLWGMFKTANWNCFFLKLSRLWD